MTRDSKCLVCTVPSLRKVGRVMVLSFSLACADDVVSRRRVFESGGDVLFLRDFCTASLVESLKPDEGLRAFARLPEREHALLRRIAERADCILTLAYTEEGVIVGQATLAQAEDFWRGLENTWEIAFEVSAGWRRRGVARQLLDLVFEQECLEDQIIIGLGLSWHWDTAGLGMSSFAYRAMIERLMASYGFAEYLTTEENIRMDPANIFLARPGRRVPVERLSRFYDRLLQFDTLPGM